MAQFIASSSRLAAHDRARLLLFGSASRSGKIPTAATTDGGSSAEAVTQRKPRAMAAVENPGRRLSLSQQQVAQAKKILRHGQEVDVPDSYILKPGEEEVGGLRRRRVAGQATQSSERTPSANPVPQPTPTHFETVHGPTAHGAVALGSTAASVAAGLLNPLAAFDGNALRNAGSDTMTSAGRARREFGRGEYTNAAISTGQAALSGVQTILSTPVAHAASHAASVAVGSPVPLPAADAVWYPANWLKQHLDKGRTEKVKTE